MSADLSEQAVLVAGGTRSIGRAISLRFGAAGAKVAASGRTPEPGRALVEEMARQGQDAHFIQGDLTDYEQVRRMVQEAIDRYGRVDTLVASAAGRTKPGLTWSPFQNIDPDDYYDHAINQWFSKAYSIHAVLDHMIERGGGKIVMIATDAGRYPTIGESMNGAGAAASIHMAKTLAKELLRYNIRINVVAVSIVDTPDSAIFHPEIGREMTPFMAKMMGRVKERQKLPVYGEDVAAAALYLASPAGDAITGQVLSVNGGISVV